MIIEVLARNRKTKQMRKIRKEYPQKDMRNVEDILRNFGKDEAIIEIRINAEPLL